MSSYVPLSSEVHKGKHWLRYTSLEFAKRDNVVPIFANELPEAMQALPIAFIKHQERFELVVVMGLKPGENLLVSESGQWMANYTPVHYRTRPFLMLDAPGDTGQQVLCIEESRITENSLGEPLFNESGNITAVINEVFKLLTHYSTTHLLTRNICDTLEKYKLIVPWDVIVNDGAAEVPFNGLYRIDELALKALPDDAFLALRDNSALSVIYGQLLSMSNMVGLSNLLAHRAQSVASVKKQETGGGTFNFAGL